MNTDKRNGSTLKHIIKNKQFQ